MLKKARVLKIKIRDLFIVLAIIAVVAVGVFAAKTDLPGQISERFNNPATGLATAGQAKLDMYVMSQCPYGVQAENGALEAIKNFGNSVDYNIYFIGRQTATGFTSLHGQPEVDENMRQVCIIEQYPAKFNSYLLCLNKNYQTAASSWEKCAADNGIDKEKIKTCVAGEQGKQLLAASMKASDNIKATGSPTIYLNDKQYIGARDALSFTRAICAQIPGADACKQIPICAADTDCTADDTKIGTCIKPNTQEAKCEYTADVPVQLTVLNDKNCGDACDPTQIVAISKKLFPNLKEVYVDYNTTEGQKLFKDMEIKMLPAYIFDSNAASAARFEQVQDALIETSGNYLIDPRATGSEYNPTLVETPKTLQLFVMSQCPYGVQAENNMKQVLDLFGSQIKFELKFIANQNPDGSFTSLHGQPEVQEDLRQVCAIKYSPEKYYNYILCINKNYTSAGAIWEKCAADNGIDKEKIKTCSEGAEGKQLLADNIKASADFGVSGSPTFIINGKYTLGGAQPAETIKQNICKYNDLTGCDTTLAAAEQQVSASGGC